MKKRIRNISILLLSIIATVALALVDITSKGTITTGFLGMAVLVLGSLIIPTAIGLIKENRN